MLSQQGVLPGSTDVEIPALAPDGEVADVQADMQYAVAVIGMTCRFPGANTVEQFWENLCAGKESISFFTDEELAQAGIVPNSPDYVKAAPVLDNPEYFDAAFFGYSPRDAQYMDPQQRILLECSWEALEHAGYDAERYDGRIGVFAGSAMNTYLLYSGLIPQFASEYLPILLGNDKDFLATRVSYKLNLTGPSITVQSACSTSLVAVHTACQNLLNEECDMALAGGVSVRVPHMAGYQYHEGSVFSRDGHCRPFDAAASGTVFGSGAGVVLLKRYEDAVRDGDEIHALIRGSAVNNDGASKADYTAPSISQQAEVIIEALASADVDADTISYVEAHGTGTALGDPIEIAALTRAYRTYTERNGYCTIGSVKGNVGHLDAAAGMAGLIKTVLALKHAQIPGTVHYKSPNPRIDFESSPFYVNPTLIPWNGDGGPRRAGITSLGIGGTNAHLILQEAPPAQREPTLRQWHLLPLSAKSADALDAAAAQLARHLSERGDGGSLADVAFTLQQGRREFAHRSMIVASSAEDVVAELAKPKRINRNEAGAATKDVVFMFSGQGSQHVNMARGLYEEEPVFRRAFDQCATVLKTIVDMDLCQVLYADDPLLANEASARESAELLNQTRITQPALFTIEYALATQLLHWGIQPSALVGHSIGAYAAACLAGVFSLEDALWLTANRGRMMQEMEPGSMLAVQLPEDKLRPLLDAGGSVAAFNSTGFSVVSGATGAIDALAQKLAAQGIATQTVRTSHAFHSAMMEPMLDAFRAIVQQVALHPPQIPMLSDMTGTWLSPEEATDPEYWVQHIRQTVRFADCLSVLMESPERVLLEVGPGRALSIFAQQHAHRQATHTVLTSMRQPKEQTPDAKHLLQSLGRLWLSGVAVDWSALYAGEHRRRVPLPTYPFQRKRYWLHDPSGGGSSPTAAAGARAIVNGGAAIEYTGPSAQRASDSVHLYVPSWRRTELPPQHHASTQSADASWLLFGDGSEFSHAIGQRLKSTDQRMTHVLPGADYDFDPTTQTYRIDPAQPAHYERLLADVAAAGNVPTHIIHLWNSAAIEAGPNALERYENSQQRGFFSLSALARYWGGLSDSRQMRLLVVTSHVHEVNGTEAVDPLRATVLGPARVIPKEFTQISCCAVDIDSATLSPQTTDRIAQQLLSEFGRQRFDGIVAYRGKYRWVEDFELANELMSEPHEPPPAALKDGGTYVITGGLGGIGVQIAKHLSNAYNARIAVIGRSELPRRESWESWVREHPADEAVAQRIRAMQAIEAHGPAPLYICADVTDLRAMRGALENIRDTLGAIDGVIHAAGTFSEGQLAQKSPEEMASVLDAKVKGTLVLAEVCRAMPVEFVCLFSSTSAHLAPSGWADYSAANIFMDHFAAAVQGRGGTRFISINWPGWLETGMLARIADSPLKKAIEQQAITVPEGLSLFERLLAQTNPQVFVSTVPLTAAGPLAAHKRPPVAAENVQAIKLVNTNAPSSSAALAPGKNIEQILHSIWSEALGIEQIDVDDDFFELGGHSLLAVTLINSVERAFNVRLASSILMQAPTIAEMAAAIDMQSTNQMWSSLVPIQPTGTKPPLFFVHAHTGDVIGYHDLAHHLGPDQPLYGLRAQGLDSGLSPFKRLAEMAAHYIQEIKSVQPDGPYYIGGYCMGGVVAQEMAHQLQNAGDEVALLVMVAGAHVDYPRYRPELSRTSQAFCRLYDWLERTVMTLLESKRKRQYMANRINRLKGYLQVQYEPFLARLFPPNLRGYVHSQGYILEKLGRAHAQFLNTHVAGPYSGKTLLMRNEKQPRGIIPDLYLGWSEEEIGGVEVCEIPGHFIGMLSEPRVQLVADRLKRSL